MSDRLVTAESVRISRAAEAAAWLAGEAQERAREARIEQMERRVQRTLNVLFTMVAVFWLLGLGVVLAWEYLP